MTARKTTNSGKKGGSKPAPAPGLAEEIASRFEMQLLEYQQMFGPPGNVWTIWAQTWNPQSNAAINQLSFLYELLEAFAVDISRWRAQGRVNPMVLEMPGAWTLVGGFQACAAVWATTPPGGERELPEIVRNTIRAVSQGLALTLGMGASASAAA